ncbi:unnamed protein product, partial [marine sediment metagenome]
MPHDYGDWLKLMLGLVSKSWSKCIAGRAWKEIKNEFGIEGFVRALEITEGPNGWHPHMHILLFVRRPLTEAERAALEDVLYKRWSDAIVAGGGSRPSREHGVVLSPGEDAGDYVAKITKQGLAEEVGRSDTKRALPGHRSILQLMHDWAEYKRHA